MLYSIKNDNMKVKVNSTGAELMNITSAKDNLEYIWQGNSGVWDSHAPILFPIVGSLRDNKYIYNEKEYHLSCHGFAYNSEFEVIEKTEDSIVFKLTENESTLKNYPFEFELYTKYKINSSTLEITHSVVNNSNDIMWFSIGDHPGFNCPLFEGEKMEDYHLVFEKNETINRKFLEGGLVGNKQEIFLNNESQIKLTHNMFNDYAILLEGFKSTWVSMENNKNNRSLKIDFGNCPYLAIWSTDKKELPFICIEPRFGIASSINNGYDIYEKEGMLKIKPLEKFEYMYKITIS